MCLSYSFLFAEYSINSQAGRYVAEDLVTGMRRSGQMSVVRRFFCLLVTFDLLFTSLLWLIVILVCILLTDTYNISLPEVNCAIPCATSCVRITVHLFCHSFHNCDVIEESSGLMLSFKYDLANNPVVAAVCLWYDHHGWGKESYFVLTRMQDDSHCKTTPHITYVCQGEVY